MTGLSLVTIAREVQVPLLATVIISGCAAKAWYRIQAWAAGAGTEPTATFPLGRRHPATIALCAAELVLGIGLLLTAGRAGAGTPAVAVRMMVALLFCTAAGALHVLRARRPDAGCGCFGELSSTPVGWRVMARAALLSVAALATIGLPPLRMPASAGQAWQTLAVTAAELAVLFALSPEAGQVIARLSHTDPCEVREVPVARTLSALRASGPWRRYRRFLVSEMPVDVWRESCWRFAVYPAVIASRRVEVVFAVHLSGRGAPVRVGIVDTGANLADEPLQLSKFI